MRSPPRRRAWPRRWRRSRRPPPTLLPEPGGGAVLAGQDQPLDDAGCRAGQPRVPPELGWDRAVLIAKATGRSPLTAAERRAVQDAGLRWLALG
jgi:hypothetical protein